MSDRFHPSRLFGSWPKKSASVGAKTAMKPDSATLLTIDDNAAIGLEDGINEMKKATKRYTDAGKKYCCNFLNLLEIFNISKIIGRVLIFDF